MIEPSRLYHTSVESGIRCLGILEAAYPTSLDINQLVALDHIAVHSADFVPDGPASLHPASPYRRAEPIIRREVVHRGLRLITGRGLATRIHTRQGFTYLATEEASPFLASLTSDYWRELLLRTRWDSRNFKEMDWHQLARLMQVHVDNWVAKFADVDHRIESDV
jgi:hypothetical protein